LLFTPISFKTNFEILETEIGVKEHKVGVKNYIFCKNPTFYSKNKEIVYCKVGRFLIKFLVKNPNFG